MYKDAPPITIEPDATMAPGSWRIERSLAPKIAPAAPVKLYDGLTSLQCLKRFEAIQRGESRDRLTPAQKLIASALWSEQLRAKVRDAKPKLTIMVDGDLDE